MSLCCECGCNIRKDLISINLHKAKSIFAMQSISANRSVRKSDCPYVQQPELHGVRTTYIV